MELNKKFEQSEKEKEQESEVVEQDAGPSLAEIEQEILNAADEVAVAAFLDHRIRFTEIVEVVADALNAVPFGPITTLADALEADASGRTAADEAVVDRAVR